MKQTDFFTSFDGTKLWYSLWPAKGNRLVVIVHGFAEHSDRYRALAEELHGLEFSVITFDLRGHGRSEGRRADVEHFEDFLEDAEGLLRHLQSKLEHPESRVLIGHSLGGTIATHLAVRNPVDWKALILSSPFFGCPAFHPLIRQASTVASFFLPLAVWKKPVKPENLTHDPEALDAYARDRFIASQLSLRLAREMIRGADSAYKAAKQVTLPLLILAAGDDRIVSLEKTSHFFDNVGSDDKKMFIFDGYFHEILQEIHKEKPVSEIKHFLKTQGMSQRTAR